MGYHRAGFDVVGVDIVPQSNYPFEFVQADALKFIQGLIVYGVGSPPYSFDAIHASPPCQAHSALNNCGWVGDGHFDLIAATRGRLESSRVPWMIENVPGSPLHNPTILCGSMFGLRIERGYLRRHRLFESSFSLSPPCGCDHRGRAIGVHGHGAGGYRGGETTYDPLKARSATAEEARRLLGIDWMNRDGMAQAIPPAYTEFIGRALLNVVLARR